METVVEGSVRTCELTLFGGSSIDQIHVVWPFTP